MLILYSGDRKFETFFRKVEGRAGEVPASIEKQVRAILAAVRKDGDSALLAYTGKFDGVKLTASTMRVKPKEIEKAYAALPEEDIDALRLAARRIADFHERQKQSSWFMQEEGGALLGQRVLPLDTVGIYVPGGKAAYPSSVLMNAVPAKVAGVEQLIMCSPATGGALSPYILVAADIAGVTEIFRIGGAQAVAAMAYGTATVPKVDKIVGPGNIYVATAKRQVFGQVDIDMIAGPTEVVVVAGPKADPTEAASDLLAQAEHDVRAVAVLLTPSPALAEAVERALLPSGTAATARSPEGGGLRARRKVPQGRPIIAHRFPKRGIEAMSTGGTGCAELPSPAGATESQCPIRCVLSSRTGLVVD